MNDLCINYMASRVELPRFSSATPKRLAAGLFSLLHVTEFCGIWWSLRIMFPSRRYSSLSLICIFRSGKESGNREIKISAWVYFVVSLAPLLCKHSVDRKPYECFYSLCANFSSWLLVWHCRSRFFRTARLRNRDIFIVSARCCYKFCFFRLHMVNDYMHLWHLIALLFCHLMSCKASEAKKKWFNILPQLLLPCVRSQPMHL